MGDIDKVEQEFQLSLLKATAVDIYRSRLAFLRAEVEGIMAKRRASTPISLLLGLKFSHPKLLQNPKELQGLKL